MSHQQPGSISGTKEIQDWTLGELVFFVQQSHQQSHQDKIASQMVTEQYESEIKKSKQENRNAMNSFYNSQKQWDKEKESFEDQVNGLQQRNDTLNEEKAQLKNGMDEESLIIKYENAKYNLYIQLEGNNNLKKRMQHLEDSSASALQTEKTKVSNLEQSMVAMKAKVDGLEKARDRAVNALQPSTTPRRIPARSLSRPVPQATTAEDASSSNAKKRKRRSSCPKSFNLSLNEV